MNTPCSLKISKLRKKSRILLDQLESNSALLERRLKKLKHTARTSKHSDKSWTDLPPSPLKRKYESWRARNYSGQVSAALSTKLYNLSSSSTSTGEGEMNIKLSDAVTSPIKRVKQNAAFDRRKKKKELCKKCHSPLKSSTEIDMMKTGESMADYCKKSKSKTDKLDVFSQSGSQMMQPNSCGKIKDKHFDGEQEKKTLETLHGFIDYSPESVFLRRLKERAQSVGDLIAPGNIRETSKSCSSSPCRKQTTVSEDVRICSRTIRSSPMKESPVKISTNIPKCLYDQSEAGKCAKQSPSLSTRRYTGRTSHRCESMNRKRVCYRKNCYCRTLPKVKARKKEVTEGKENDILEKDPCTEEVSTSIDCGCHCDNHRRVLDSKSSASLSDRVANLLEDKTSHAPCSSKRCERWFEGLNRFRKSHWFDCHAHSVSSNTNLDVSRNWDGTSCESLGHKCVHKYKLDERLRPRPLQADHLHNCPCCVCHVTSNFPTRDRPVITLPSKLQNAEIKVSIPIKSQFGKQSYSNVPASTLSYKKTPAIARERCVCSPRGKPLSRLFTRTLGDLKPQPPPTDSLALRYQKGVFK